MSRPDRPLDLGRSRGDPPGWAQVHLLDRGSELCAILCAAVGGRDPDVRVTALRNRGASTRQRSTEGEIAQSVSTTRNCCGLVSTFEAIAYNGGSAGSAVGTLSVTAAPEPWLRNMI
jgi:hypothetical protein